MTSWQAYSERGATMIMETEPTSQASGPVRAAG